MGDGKNRKITPNGSFLLATIRPKMPQLNEGWFEQFQNKNYKQIVYL